MGININGHRRVQAAAFLLPDSIQKGILPGMPF